jgi:Domain of unknown function (DUF4276)
VSGVAIYLEGGGESKEGKAALRLGMSGFLGALRDAARGKSLHWKVVPCGGRDEAHGAFWNAARTSTETINLLLVDSEGPVTLSPRGHLSQHDGWDIRSISDESIHLMIQVMEAWIIADGNALADYYGRDFQRSALPSTKDFESVTKKDILDALKRAKAKTRKGEYHKIRHAADLLGQVDAEIVRQRCPSCARLFATVERAIHAA